MKPLPLCCIAVWFASVSAVFGAEPIGVPAGVPPVVGQAIVTPSQGGKGWQISLSLSEETWKAIRPVMPNLEWPEIVWVKAVPSNRKGTMALTSDQMPSQFCVVDLDGKPLSGDRILTKLSSTTPVLVSPTESLPPRRWLQEVSPCEMIVVLGPFQPKDEAKDAKEDLPEEEEFDLSEWTEEKSKRYFFSLVRRARGYRIKTEEEAKNYLRGTWRLVKQAHVGGGHYIHSDRGDDMSVVCNDEWLLVRMSNNQQAQDSIGKVNRVQLDDKGHVRVQSNPSIVFNHFLPLDENHMSVLAYDFYAIVRRVDRKESESTEKDVEDVPAMREKKESPSSGAIQATKAHMTALLSADRATLEQSYAAEVRQLPKRESSGQGQAIARAMKIFAGGNEQLAKMMLPRLVFEELKVASGEFRAAQTALAKDKGLSFQIEDGDAVVRVSQHPGYWYFQLRQIDGRWKVVAHFLN